MSMVGSGRLLDLIGLAYDAAADPTLWSVCLSAVGAVVQRAAALPAQAIRSRVILSLIHI